MVLTSWVSLLRLSWRFGEVNAVTLKDSSCFLHGSRGLRKDVGSDFPGCAEEGDCFEGYGCEYLLSRRCIVACNCGNLLTSCYFKSTL